MNRPIPYRAVLNELHAINEALAQAAITEAEQPAFYRREAARLRAEADTAEAVEMRVVLLGLAVVAFWLIVSRTVRNWLRRSWGISSNSKKPTIAASAGA